MGKTGLLSLGRSLRVLQGAASGAVRSPFRFQCGFQFCDPSSKYCRRIIVTSAVENNNRNSAILHEAVTGAYLIGTLLRGLAGLPLQAQGTTHSVFSRLCVAR